MAHTAWVFPGQGSQAVGMLAELAVANPVVQETFAEASAALGLDLWALAQNGPEAVLNATQNTQPVLLTAGIAVWRAWQQAGGARPDYVAGHSLGEYTALVAAGVLSLADGVRLVAERGRLMQEAVPAGEGAMAAILGLDDAAVIAACAEAGQGEVVSAVNFNAPGQVVIAGRTAAVQRAIELLKAAGAKRALPLPVSAPSHCDLMRPAATRLAQHLTTIPFNDPVIPVVQNVSARVAGDRASLQAALLEQLYSPVRWVESVQWLVDHGVTCFIESGPGKVLTGLDKRIAKDAEHLAIDAPDAFQAALARA
ncbi:ACP S-malonyltransferase [Perlucidibaca piscinae]|uniref:ACP S-malonyltransferase n=1 Tax=Perlucidibaca piscinae TaxID=392589 RepID=UPI0003B375EE|nr:ACP S-malonyltransferase [Perlucidibaca piscinae]